ncbi:hypothetical protein [Microbacterium atlanticum]|uniref:hypothetical protein n=1 Tax=Microbacterium atlanticum TaxID=2782168 RepID=UPI0018888674|nr:hypothetical protein [Microbacterium atlanticum]
MEGPRWSDHSADADELERLRRRAYGPDADIGDDPSAQARLEELEAADRRRRTVAARTNARPDVPGDAGPIDAAEDGGAPAGAAVRPRRRSAAAAVAAASVVVFAAFAASTSSPVDHLPTRTATGPEAVLAPLPRGAAPVDPHGVLGRMGLSAAELRRYDGFDGLAVWSGRSRFGTMCLVIREPHRALGLGSGAEGCAPYGAGASVELLVDDAPRRDFVRFVLLNGHVVVYVYEGDAVTGDR